LHTCDGVHQIGQLSEDELSSDKAIEGLSSVEILLVASAFVQSEQEEVLDLLLLAIGQNEGFADLIGSVDGLEDIRHGLCFFKLLQLALLLFLRKQIEKDLPV
jgi:hypothetical protein